jgi:hypothetical protein
MKKQRLWYWWQRDKLDEQDEGPASDYAYVECSSVSKRSAEAMRRYARTQNELIGPLRSVLVKFDLP